MKKSITVYLDEVSHSFCLDAIIARNMLVSLSFRWERDTVTR